jgi:O-antigen/teichoic acid export membrane protein
MKESIVKGVLKYSVSTWVNFFIGFFAVVVTTRILPPEIYGTITLFISASNVLMNILEMGLGGTLMRFYNEPPGDVSQNQLVYSNIYFSTIIFFAVCGLVLSIDNSLALKIFSLPTKQIIWLVLIHAYCGLILRYLNISYRMSFRAKKYTLQNVIINSSTKILIIVAALYCCQTLYILKSLTVGILCVTFVYLICQRKDIAPINKQGRIDFTLHLAGYGPYLRFAMFSAPTYWLYYFNTFITQQIIQSSLGSYSLGIYSSTSMFSAILATMQGGFSTFWSAYVFKNYAEDKHQITKGHDFAVLISIFIVSILIMCRDIIYLFIGNQYHESKLFFSLLLVSPVLSLITETTAKGIGIAKRNHINVINSLVYVGANLGLCYWLIPSGGLKWAGYVNAFAAILFFTLNTIMGQKYYKSIASVKRSIAGITIIIAILWFSSMFQQLYILWMITLVLDVIAVFVYKEDVLTIKSWLSTVRLKKSSIN